MPSFASPQIDALLEHIPINETRDVLWLHLLSHVLFGKLAFLESWPFWKAGSHCSGTCSDGKLSCRSRAHTIR
jgi:hypothetical protein